jgi:hypothetical protein
VCPYNVFNALAARGVCVAVPVPCARVCGRQVTAQYNLDLSEDQARIVMDAQVGWVHCRVCMCAYDGQWACVVDLRSLAHAFASGSFDQHRCQHCQAPRPPTPAPPPVPCPMSAPGARNAFAVTLWGLYWVNQVEAATVRANETRRLEAAAAEEAAAKSKKPPPKPTPAKGEQQCPTSTPPHKGEGH